MSVATSQQDTPPRLDPSRLQQIAAAVYQSIGVPAQDAQLAAGHSQMYYPGELEKQGDAENRAKGLLLASETMTDLVRVARQAGVECSL